MTSHFPSNPQHSRCGSCNRPIMWVVTENGRRMPLDPDPVPDGNFMLLTRKKQPPLAISKGRDWIASLDYGEAPPTEEPKLYVSHFATCPNAAKHRKK